MEKVTLRRDIQIRNDSNLRVIDIHDRKLRRAAIRAEKRVVLWPVRLVGEVVVGVGVRVEIGNERDDPVFHVLGDGDVVCACDVLVSW